MNRLEPSWRRLYVVIDADTGVIWNCFTGATKALALQYKLTTANIKARVRILMPRDVEKAVAEWSYDFTEYREADDAQVEKRRGN